MSIGIVLVNLFSSRIIAEEFYRDLEPALVEGLLLLVHDLQHAGLLDEGLLVEPAALALRLRLVADDHLEGSKSNHLNLD